MNLPNTISSLEALEELLTRPSTALVQAISQFSSPLVVLGASGKMGPTLCVLARRAAEAAGHRLQVIAVSRFSDPVQRSWLEARGVETISCDLLQAGALNALPPSDNLVYLVGLKFGTDQNPSMTWAVNTIAPARVAERYPRARIIALSTGNVYQFAPVTTLGALETDPPAPVGDYAGAALARERIFEYYSRAQRTPVVLLRLNYAVELRYGVLLDIAEKVWSQEPIDLSSGYLNCIWQGDANDMILRALSLASTPPGVYNLTGPSLLSVRELAGWFAQRFGRPLRCQGTENPTALISDSSVLCGRLGAPPTPLEHMLEWTAQWLVAGGPTLGKPTHFEVRTGTY